MNQIMRLTVELGGNGQISVTGPIHDKVFCYGLLEAAKDAIREHVAVTAAKNVIEAAPANILAALPKIGGNGNG